MKRIVNTNRFGSIEVQDQHIIHFKDGMVGFVQLKDYFIVESSSLPLLLWLQSVDNPAIAFPVVEPAFFQRDYKAVPTEADKARLELEVGEATKQFVVMTIPEDMTKMTVNMKAPVVVNLEKGLGSQMILQDKNLLVRKPAHEAFNKAVASLSLDHDDIDVESEEDFNWSPVDYKGVSQVG
ncbi:flagellar assembly protein FliW [bacterium]|nr:flagellar assembly protein FliW [bacterium]